MSHINLDWHAIRPLNGSKAHAFEELCAQLARSESPEGSTFERKGVPDAGVECYALLRDGTEWGWQAKYFDGLGDAQWAQLDKSVSTALEKHPRMVRYFVCAPLDRADARIAGRRSARDRWDEHVDKWTRWAQARDMSVAFTWWGSHELLERLSLPEHVGRVHFWFDVRGFDQSWFTDRINEALKTAGPRYTPEIHVSLPIAAEFEAFGRTSMFFDEMKGLARKLRSKVQQFRHSQQSKEQQPTDSLVSTVLTDVSDVLTALSQVAVQPIDLLPFGRIAARIATARDNIAKLERELDDLARKHDSRPADASAKTEPERYPRNPFRDRQVSAFQLGNELRKSGDALEHAQTVSGSTLMILKGSAGTGKTHLLCDVALHRLQAGRPTVLLMGQRFTSLETPWVQALQQLDLATLSAEEFIGALEAAAQTANCRALVMIDAVNEGSGRLIWPTHLEAFLAHCQRSPWIGVVLSVRSSYEDLVLPEGVRKRAVHVTHYGFDQHEYDATRTFFLFYGLELPSTPLLAPEFRNPLFLKTLCRGLHEQGERRLPRGLNGITAIFELYLRAINDRLAAGLGYNPREPLVKRALEAFAKSVAGKEERWLNLSEAEAICHALLPGRDFERSLYRGLLSEGVLVEEALPRGGLHQEIVFVSYERFADHLIATFLLDSSLKPSDLEAAFAEGGGLAFLGDEKRYVAPGLLEALCIQVPERTTRDLVSLAPTARQRWGMGDAFRQSLVWRAHSAFSDETIDALNSFLQTDHDEDDTFEVLLTVATLPDHPLNANFLDQHLRSLTLPERDARWSIYLHSAWESHGAVDRLVDWAWSVKADTDIEESSVELAAVALAWMLTSSHRFLRDRATKALVSLLTSRLQAMARIVERFAYVNDPYVVERVYAAAYGVAMRSTDVAAVNALATTVYSQVFAERHPPAHLLLRDYARGVVERAIYLGGGAGFEAQNIRPPYQSTWPHIPSEEEIKPLKPDWSRGSHDSGDVEWARNRIGSSILDDDFSHYVIGTNSSSEWLALRIDDPPWQSPRQRLAALVGMFTVEEKLAWDNLAAAQARVRQLTTLASLRRLHKSLGKGDVAPRQSTGQQEDEAGEAELLQAQESQGAALELVKSVLAADHISSLQVILKEGVADEPPRFDLKMVQRYILWRVFDLGWTTERFGYFDRFYIGYHGRSASKAERIGKKYQWIAYFEIMALIADHFQYRERYRDDGDKAYKGPWQGSERDIDPSCTLKSTPGGTSLRGHASAWWGSARYEAWAEPTSSSEWVRSLDDLPVLGAFLKVEDPATGVHWLNLQGHLSRTQPGPADQELYDVDRGELWFHYGGYLLREDDADAFMAWAEGVDFWGRWMPDPPEFYRLFLGEHGWSPASNYFEQPYFGHEEWIRPSKECPVTIKSVAVEYVQESSDFDCSVDEGFRLRLPSSDLLSGLNLTWSGVGADYHDSDGAVAASDPTAHSSGPSALLLQEEILRQYLRRERLAICWAVIGEKRVLGTGPTSGPRSSLHMSGAYRLSDDGPAGFLKCFCEDWNSNTSRSLELLKTLRSGGKQ